MNDFYMDVVGAISWAPPLRSHIFGSEVWVQNLETGFVNHRPIESMTADEYGEFNANPIAFMANKALPRMNRALRGDSKDAALVKTLAFMASKELQFFRDVDKVVTKNEVPIYYGTMIYHPFDFIGNFLRGISNALLDTRKRCEELDEACDKLTNLFIRYTKTTLALSESKFPKVCLYI